MLSKFFVWLKGKVWPARYPDWSRTWPTRFMEAMSAHLRGPNKAETAVFVCLNTLYHIPVSIRFAPKGLLIIMKIGSVAIGLANSPLTIWPEQSPRRTFLRTFPSQPWSSPITFTLTLIQATPITLLIRDVQWSISSTGRAYGAWHNSLSFTASLCVCANLTPILMAQGVRYARCDRKHYPFTGRITSRRLRFMKPQNIWHLLWDCAVMLLHC